MLNDSRRRDLSLLYLTKQQKDQTKWFDIFISFEIQIEKKLLQAWEKEFFVPLWQY